MVQCHANALLIHKITVIYTAVRYTDAPDLGKLRPCMGHAHANGCENIYTLYINIHHSAGI